jgi:hypothetical protein
MDVVLKDTPLIMVGLLLRAFVKCLHYNSIVKDWTQNSEMIYLGPLFAMKNHQTKKCLCGNGVKKEKH